MYDQFEMNEIIFHSKEITKKRRERHMQKKRPFCLKKPLIVTVKLLCIQNIKSKFETLYDGISILSNYNRMFFYALI